MRQKPLLMLAAAAALSLCGCASHVGDDWLNYDDPGQIELARMFHQAFDGKNFDYIREVLGVTYSDGIGHRIGYKCGIVLHGDGLAAINRAMEGGDPNPHFTGADLTETANKYRRIRDNRYCDFIWQRLEQFFEAGGPVLTYDEVVKLNNDRWNGTLPTKEDKEKALAERRRAQQEKNARLSAARRAQIEKENPVILKRGIGTLLRSPDDHKIVIIRKVRGAEILVQNTLNNEAFWDFPDNWELMKKDLQEETGD